MKPMYKVHIEELGEMAEVPADVSLAEAREYVRSLSRIYPNSSTVITSHKSKEEVKEVRTLT